MPKSLEKSKIETKAQTFRADIEFMEELKSYASTSGISQSEIIRRAVNDYIEVNPIQKRNRKSTQKT